MITLRTIKSAALRMRNTKCDSSFAVSPRRMEIRNVSGFTFVEMTIVIAILSVLFGTAAVTLGNFMTNQALRADGSTIVQTLREAHTRATASEQGSDWGVYFDTALNPDRVVLFKGVGYIGHDPAFDQVTDLHSNVAFGPFLLNGGGSEVVFSKRSGTTAHDGLFSLVSENQAFTVTINPLGLTDYD
jgi:prepilin-type N-terminal cleavage/methylation domain-containing protein